MHDLAEHLLRSAATDPEVSRQAALDLADAVLGSRLVALARQVLEANSHVLLTRALALAEAVLEDASSECSAQMGEGR